MINAFLTRKINWLKGKNISTPIEPSSEPHSDPVQKMEEVSLNDLDELLVQFSAGRTSIPTLSDKISLYIEQNDLLSLKNLKNYNEFVKFSNSIRNDNMRHLYKGYRLISKMFKVANLKKSKQEYLFLIDFVCYYSPWFFKNLNIQDIVTKNDIFQQIENLSNNFIDFRMGIISYEMINYFLDDNAQVSNLSLRIFQAISKYILPNNSITCIPRLYSILNHSTNIVLTITILQILSKMIDNKSLGRIVISLKNFNIESILKRFRQESQLKQLITEFSRFFLIFMQATIDQWSQTKITEFMNFITDNFYPIVPEIIDIYIKLNPRIPNLRFRLISEYLAGNTIDKLQDKEIMQKLNFELLNQIISNKLTVNCSPKRQEPSNQFRDIFTKNRLENLNFEYSVTGFKSFVNNKNHNPLQIYNSSVLKSVYEYLSKQETNYKYFKKELVKLKDLCIIILSIIPFPTPNDPFPSKSIDDFLDKKLRIKVKKDNAEKDFTVKIHSYFKELEVLVNQEFDGLTEQPGELKKGVSIVNKDDLLSKHVQYSLSQNQNFKFYFFTCKRNFYVNKQNILHAISDSTASISSFSREKLIFAPILNENKLNLEPSLMKVYVDERIEVIFRILEEIYRLNPKLDFKDNYLIHKVDYYFRNFISGTLSRSSYVPWLIYRFPFLFPLKMRYTASVIVNNDLNYGCDVFSLYLTGSKSKSFGVDIEINYDDVFNAGNVFLSICRLPMFNYIPKIEGNLIGLQRFWTKYIDFLYKDFYNRIVNLCIYNFTRKIFLYPFSDNKEKQLIITLGIIVGKSIAMGLTLPFEIHPALFDMILGKKLTIKDISEDFDKEMEEKEFIGRTFTYPHDTSRTIGQEMKITDHNINIYKEKVISYTCGDDMEQTLNLFKSGISKCIDISTLSVLTGREISQMLYGGNGPFQREEILKIDHEKISEKQFDVFVKFITTANEEKRVNFLKNLVGAQTVPFNDLLMLQPKIEFEKGQKFEFDPIKPKITMPENVTIDMFE